MIYFLYIVVILFSLLIVAPYLKNNNEYVISLEKDSFVALTILVSLFWIIAIPAIAIILLVIGPGMYLYNKSDKYFADKTIKNLPEINESKSTYRHVEYD